MSLAIRLCAAGAVLLAAASQAVAVDVMQPLNDSLVLDTLVTFPGGRVVALNRDGRFAGNPWVLGNPDGTAPTQPAQNLVRLREAMAAELLKLAAGAPDTAHCTQLDRNLTCVGNEMTSLRALFTQHAGATPDVASIRGNGAPDPRQIFIAEGKPGATIGTAAQQLQDFRRVAAESNYAMPDAGQLIVTEDRVRTAAGGGYAVGPRDLTAETSTCILYNAERVGGHERAARFFAVEQPDQPDTGPAVSRLTGEDRQPRQYAIFFLRPSATPLAANTTIRFSNICKLVPTEGLGPNEHVVAYQAGDSWFYAQTGAAVVAGARQQRRR